MTSFTAGIHGATKATDSEYCVSFRAEIMKRVDVFAPRHVAKATADAFNRAMQAKERLEGYEYRTDAGLWLIFPGNDVSRGIWTYQHDDAEDDCPGWMHGTGTDLFDCMDQIDEIGTPEAAVTRIMSEDAA